MTAFSKRGTVRGHVVHTKEEKIARLRERIKTTQRLTPGGTQRDTQDVILGILDLLGDEL